MNNILNKIPYDKKLHIGCGFLIGLFGGFFRLEYGIALSVLAGIAKEVYDYHDYGKFDKYDMFATWLGGLVGVLLVYLIKVII